ncbi:hypothetical protein BGW39_000797 [Mortierella sp. 14UC]|nr:hypothetical protein BGW39_000797 [Mortierella sp. 14UC]
MVGVATPEDPSKYPQLQDPFSHFGTVLGGKRLSWGAYSVPGQIWLLIDQYENPEQARKQKIRNSEWSPELNETMIKEFFDKPCPYGGKMGDLIDATPNELISKVYVEEKLFKTWFYGRTVLLGDGAINALQDAAILANGFYDLKNLKPESITAMFQEYVDQRFEKAKVNVENSRLVTRILGGQTLSDRIIRTLMFNFIPKALQQRDYAKKSEYRPQVAFLPLVANTGTGNVLPQRPS